MARLEDRVRGDDVNRPKDGAERFFECAEEAGFEVSACATHARVVLCEMRRK